MRRSGKKRCAEGSKPVAAAGSIDPLRWPAGAFFRAAFHSSVVGAVLNDAQGRLVRVNATFARMLGYRVAELRGRHISDITDADDIEESRRQIEALWAGRIRRIRMEKRYCRRDGGWVWARTHVALVKEPGRPPAYALAMVESIGARRAAAAALRSSRELATGIFRHVGEAISVIDVETHTILAANKAFLRLVDRKRRDVVGQICRDVIHPDDSPLRPGECPCPLERTLRTNRPARAEFRLRPRGGSPREIEVSIYPIPGERGKVRRVIHMHRDITRRKRGETLHSVLFEISEATSSARNLEALYRVIHRELGRLIDARNFYVALYDEEAGTYSFPFIEDECDEEVDYTPQELGKSLTDYVRRTGRALLVDEAAHARLREAGEVEVVGVPSAAWLGAPLRAGRGVIGVVAVQSYRDRDRYTKRDVELLSFVAEQIALAIERKQAVDELRRSKEFIENVFRNVSDAICVIDPETYGIVGANRAFMKGAGRRARDVIGGTCYGVSHGRSEPCGDKEDLCPMEETLRTGRPCRREHLHAGAGGRRSWVEVRTSPMRDEAGETRRIIHIAHDITERKRAELLQSVLFRISESGGSTIDLHGLFRVIHEQLGRLIDTRNFYVALYNEETGLYTFPYCVDQRDQALAVGERSLDHGLTDYVRKTGRAHLIDREGLARLEAEGKATMLGSPTRLWLGVPLRTEGRVIGVVAVHSYDDPDRFTAEDLELLTFVSDTVATAIERKRKSAALRETASLLRTTLDSTADGILAVNERGEVIQANEPFARMWCIPKHLLDARDDERLLQHVLDQLVDPDAFLEKVRELYESAEENWDVLYFRDGRVFERFSSPLMEAGEIRGRVWSFRDITERKRVEKLKDEFISIVNHELRTPLTSIQGAIDIVRGGRAGELPESAKNLLEIAGRNSVRLRKLIDDLLDIQKIESGGVKLEARPLELSAVVRQSIENNQAFGAQFNVEFVLEDGLPDLRVEGDESRLTQVMDNLLSNAAKFSPPESRVEVRVSRRSGWARVDVRDHGPGIPAAFREKVFRKFTQADSSMTREKGGTGLGLSIAKSIVERMGGTIDFETRLDEGTTFYFELPEYRGPAAGGAEAGAGD